MVGYIKGNFFVRYRTFESWAHLNQLAEQWLATEADQRLHGTVKEIVAERFEREWPLLQELPDVRYDTSYFETRQVSWDGYIEVRGNRYSVPGDLVGRTVTVRIGLDGHLRIVAGDYLVAAHRLRNGQRWFVSSARFRWRTAPEALRSPSCSGSMRSTATTTFLAPPSSRTMWVSVRRTIPN